MGPFYNTLALGVIGDASNMPNAHLSTKLFKAGANIPRAIVHFKDLGLWCNRQTGENMGNNMFGGFSCL